MNDSITSVKEVGLSTTELRERVGDLQALKAKGIDSDKARRISLHVTLPLLPARKVVCVPKTQILVVRHSRPTAFLSLGGTSRYERVSEVEGLVEEDAPAIHEGDLKGPVAESARRYPRLKIGPVWQVLHYRSPLGCPEEHLRGCG